MSTFPCELYTVPSLLITFCLLTCVQAISGVILTYSSEWLTPVVLIVWCSVARYRKTQPLKTLRYLILLESGAHRLRNVSGTSAPRNICSTEQLRVMVVGCSHRLLISLGSSAALLLPELFLHRVYAGNDHKWVSVCGRDRERLLPITLPFCITTAFVGFLTTVFPCLKVVLCTKINTSTMKPLLQIFHNKNL